MDCSNKVQLHYPIEMKKKALLCFYCFLIFTWNAFSQVTTIADTSFRKLLITRYPQFMNSQGQLVDSLAANYNGSLDCSNRYIINLSGIQKFKKLTSLNCERNQISNIDSIKNILSLTYLNCNNNPIAKVPDLGNLNKLRSLSLAHASLTLLPDLSRNTELRQIDCNNNKLKQITGLAKLINLQIFNCSNNEFASLEDLSRLPNLIELQCSSNKITVLTGLDQIEKIQTIGAAKNLISVLPDLSRLKALRFLSLEGNRISIIPRLNNLSNLNYLDFSNNKIADFPDLSNNYRLKTLNLMNNLIDTVINLEKLDSLEIVNLGFNRINDPMNLSSSKSSLKFLYINDNKLSSLPDLNLFTNLSILHVQNNYLDYRDLEPMLQLKAISDYNYSPQGNVPVMAPAVIIEGNRFLFYTGLTTTGTNNTFTWYRDGAFLFKSSSDTFKIEQVKSADAGSYTCTVTNSRLQSLSLTTDPLLLKVYRCIPLTGLKYQLTSYECNVGAKIIFDTTSVSVGMAPYKVSLISKLTNKSLTPKGNIFSNIFEIQYQLLVEDPYGCSGTEELALDNHKPNKCNNQVINSEDPDGLNSIFIEEQGIAKIFDKNGKLVKTLQTPGSWDGSSGTGELIPGFYVVQINDKQFHITVIR